MFDVFPVLRGCVCALVAGSALFAADDCLLPKTCPQEAKDEQIGTPEHLETTAGGSGIIINDGNRGIPTNIDYLNGRSLPDAHKITYYAVTCIENAVTNAIGEKVVSPGRGKLAGNGLCGVKTKVKKIKYELTYTNKAGERKTATFPGDEAAPTKTSEGCGVQTIGTTTCGGGL